MPRVDGLALWQLVERRADATPDALMFEDDDGRTITFGAFRDEATRVAARVAGLGAGPDDTVSWLLPTRIDAFLLAAALARLGAVQNPLLPIYRERELRFIVGQAQPRLVVTLGSVRGVDYETMVRDATRDTGADVFVVDDGGLPIGDPSTLPPLPEVLEPDAQPVRWLFYTSGTTADPKGVRHADAGVIAAARAIVDTIEIDERDRHAVVFPVAHLGGPLWLVAGLMTGLGQLLVPAFDPQTTIPRLRDFGVTLAGAGTAFHLMYLEAQRARRDVPLFPAVRAFPGGAAPKPAGLHETMKGELGGVGIVSSYGLTEAPIIAACTVHDPDEKLASTEGRATAGVAFRVVGDDGKDVTAGEEGELRVRGPQLFRGYVNASLDRDAFDDEGWFRTGDLARLDDGYVTITGRLKDVIIRKGENISASEVEDALFAHPLVRDAAVIGLPDERSGERVCAVVVTDAGSALTLDDVTAFLSERGLMRQKLPEQLEQVDELPRNSMGKVLKQDLRKRFG